MKCAGASERYIMPGPKTRTRRKVKLIFITSWEGKLSRGRFEASVLLPSWPPVGSLIGNKDPNISAWR
jgi:hypothetical protein